MSSNQLLQAPPKKEPAGGAYPSNQIRQNWLLRYGLRQELQYYNMEANSNISEKIELFLSCRNLKDLDVFSKSDPYVKVSYKRDFTQKVFAVLGRTETKQNELNPNYQRTFQLEFVFESRQDIRFDIYDDDGNADQDDFIGSVETTVGALMGAKSMTSILDLVNPKNKAANNGKLVVRCEKLQDTNEFLQMRWSAAKLYNTDSFFDFWDKSDPYMKFLKIRDDNTFVEIQRTEVVRENLNPSWKPVDVPVSRLVNPVKGNFKIQVWDWEEDGKDQFIGQIYATPQQIVPGARFTLVNPKVKNPGSLQLHQAKMVSKPTFVDYLRGGLQLNMMVAIDFTGSNGSPQYPSSLHYMNPNAPNQYQQAILSIAQILMNYDSDKRIPSFGFGACTRFGGIKSPVSHCFALSGNAAEVQACGVEHLMQMYQKAIMNVDLSGPTYFGQLIQESAKLAAGFQSQGSETYTTLLIITDGQIHDMDRTVDLIVQASTLPLSIIIVGVGNADFTNMNRLDGDNGLYSSKGVMAPRDIVQFVPFRDVQMSGDLLAKELLAELPGQVVKYMSIIGKPPGQYVPLNVSNLIKK